MNIKEFFQLREGTWTSQRSTYYPIFKRTETGKSNIQVKVLQTLDSETADLCEQQGFNPNLVFCAAKVTWNGTTEGNSKDSEASDRAGSTVIVSFAGETDSQQGKLLQGYAEKPPVIGRYVMGADDVLSLIAEYGTFYAEEKIWFPRPNLCMRAGLTVGTSNVASFCTEIRKTEPAKPAETT